MDGILIPWVIAATVLLFVAAYWVFTLEKRLGVLQDRYDKLLKMTQAVSGDDDRATMLSLIERLDQHDARLGRLEPLVQRAWSILPHTASGMGIVRYNAFEGVGGDQSFSVALVDAAGSGAIVTGLHSGADMRVYAKPLQNWKSSYSLSPDEQRALGMARKSAEQMA